MSELDLENMEARVASHGKNGLHSSEVLALIGRVRDLAQKFADALVAKSRADDETVRLQCQLAGCLVAAEGGTAEALVVKPGEYGWSLPYEKTLRLRKERDALKALLREAVETHGPGCHENCDFEIRARAVLESE